MRKFAIAVAAAVAVCATPGYAFAAVPPHPGPIVHGPVVRLPLCTPRLVAHHVRCTPPVHRPPFHGPVMRGPARQNPGIIRQLLHSLFG
jgi:hypothetical protein